MTDPFAAPQQSGTPAPPPPPSGPPAYYAQQPYAQQPPWKPNTALIVGIIVAVSAVMIVILGILAAIAIPVFLNQRQKANDAAAKSDVASLGYLIATYYVDHDGPAPEVDVINGFYAVDGQTSEYQASQEVEFGGVEGTGYDDWCVWVTAPDGGDKDFQDSATGGLSVGNC